jgi:uncharacterized membrane protein HdeD (DUF308 family)
MNQVIENPVREEKVVRTTSQTRFAPDSIITGVVGLGTLLFGLIAIIRGGFDGSLSEPVVEVFGFSHTTILGIIEIGIGLALLLSAAMSMRSGSLFFGAALGIAGFVGAVQTDSLRETLALESSMGWIAAVAGLIVVVAALALPRVGKNATTITQN